MLPKHSYSSCRMSALGKITRGSDIAYYYLMFFIAYPFKGQVHVFAGRVKIVSHTSFRTYTILKYFCPLAFLSAIELRQGRQILHLELSSLNQFFELLAFVSACRCGLRMVQLLQGQHTTIKMKIT